MNGMYTVLQDIALLEILLVSGMAFIGAIIHEYIICIDVYKRITLRSWINIIMSVIISTIISLAINPFLFSNWPRGIIIPPFFLGLLGTQLVTKFVTFHESFGFVTYLVKLYRYIRYGEKFDDQLEESKDLSVVDENDPDEILKRAISLRLQIRNAIDSYKANKDDCAYIEAYDTIKSDIRLYRKKLEHDIDEKVINEPILQNELKELDEEEHIMDVLHHGLLMKNYN